MHVEKAQWSLSHGLTDASSSFPLFCKCFSGIRCVPEVTLELEGETLASTHLYWEEGSHLNSAPQHPPPYVNIYAYILLSFPPPFLPRGKRPLTAPCSTCAVGWIPFYLRRHLAASLFWLVGYPFAYFTKRSPGLLLLSPALHLAVTLLLTSFPMPCSTRFLILSFSMGLSSVFDILFPSLSTNLPYTLLFPLVTLLIAFFLKILEAIACTSCSLSYTPHCIPLTMTFASNILLKLLLEGHRWPPESRIFSQTISLHLALAFNMVN